MRYEQWLTEQQRATQVLPERTKRGAVKEFWEGVYAGLILGSCAAFLVAYAALQYAPVK